VNRRTVLLAIAAALVAPAALAQRSVEITSESRVTVVYIAADNCGFCREWDWAGGPRERFLASEAGRSVEFREVRRPYYQQRLTAQAFPGSLAWVWERVEVPAGTPSWVVAIDENPVLVATGLDRWEASVLPQIEVLVAKLRELRGK
jgi:hypothetical protein